MPVTYFGLALSEDEFHTLAAHLRAAEVKFILEPHLRFKGQPGEQWAILFKDPSVNNLELKAMTTISYLFVKHNSVD